MKRITCFAFTIATFAVTLFSVAGASAQRRPPQQPPRLTNLRWGIMPAKCTKIRLLNPSPRWSLTTTIFRRKTNFPWSERRLHRDANANPKTTLIDKDAPGKADEDQAKKQAEWKGWQDKLSAQKNAIDLSSRELNVLQKEYQLRAAAMYGDAGNRMRNAAEWDKEDADFKQKIADKQKAVDDAKQKLDDMQEEARKAGVPAAMREPQSTE